MACVWLGRGVSNNVWLIQALRERGLQVIGSHWLKGWAGARYVDETLVEPDLGGAAYRTWFESTLRDRPSIDLAMPGRQLGAFANTSTDVRPRLLLGSVPQHLGMIDDKAQAYAFARDQGLGCAPDVRVFNDLTSFDEGVRALHDAGHGRLCCKPSVGIFGQGFRVLDEQRSTLDLVLHASPCTMTMAAFRDGMAATTAIAPMVLMPAFDGPEVSIDAAWDGQGYRQVAREKHAAGQRVITDPAMEQLGLDVAHTFDLRGLFNVQVMRHQGRWWLLEINPRASGGLGVVGVTGVDVVGAALAPFDLNLGERTFDVASLRWPVRERWVFDEVHKVPSDR